MNRNELKKTSFRYRRKTGVPGEKPSEACWTGNQIQRQDRELNQGLVVHSAEEVPLRHVLPQIKWNESQETTEEFCKRNYRSFND